MPKARRTDRLADAAHAQCRANRPCTAGSRSRTSVPSGRHAEALGPVTRRAISAAAEAEVGRGLGQHVRRVGTSTMAAHRLEVDCRSRPPCTRRCAAATGSQQRLVDALRAGAAEPRALGDLETKGDQSASSSLLDLEMLAQSPSPRGKMLGDQDGGARRPSGPPAARPRTEPALGITPPAAPCAIAQAGRYDAEGSARRPFSSPGPSP